MMHAKHTGNNFREACATNVTIGVGAHPAQEGGAMRTNIPRVALLLFLSAFSFPFFVNAKGRRCSFHRRKQTGRVSL